MRCRSKCLIGERDDKRWFYAQIGRLIRDGMKQINHLNAIMHNKYARVPETLRAWESASHIDRAPQRENKNKSQTTAAATNGNGAATAAGAAKV